MKYHCVNCNNQDLDGPCMFYDLESLECKYDRPPREGAAEPGGAGEAEAQ